MFYSKMKIALCLLLFSIVVMSCSKDADNESSALVQNFSDGSDDAKNRSDRDRDNNNPNNSDNGNQSTAIITKWTDLFLELDRYVTGMRPTSSARALAYIHLTAYETVVPSMRDHISNSSNLNGLEIKAPEQPDINWLIALNESYAQALSHFIINAPANAEQKIRRLKSSIATDLKKRKKDNTEEKSISWGQYVANQVIAYSQTDIEGEKQIFQAQPLSYEPPAGEGYWTYSAEPERALFPYWGNVRTFIISSDETSSVPPFTYSDKPGTQYYQQMMDVYLANNAARENDGEELWIAEFWSDDVESLTFGPPSRQYAIANQLIDQFDLDIDQALLLNLKLGFALNDAAVSTWADKYEYMVMRPSVYIQDYIDPSYQTNLFRLIPWPNPSFPGYPSGHSAFASAAAGVFIDAFGNNINFTDRSHEGRSEFRGTPRQFNSFEEMAKENAFSRIPLGVHIDMDCAEGLRLGYEVADAINEYQLNKENI